MVARAISHFCNLVARQESNRLKTIFIAFFAIKFVRQRCHFQAVKSELGFDQNLSLSKFVLLGFEDSSRNCSPESPSNTDSA
jgi:hypothetical protein